MRGIESCLKRKLRGYVNIGVIQCFSEIFFNAFLALLAHNEKNVNIDIMRFFPTESTREFLRVKNEIRNLMANQGISFHDPFLSEIF